MREGHALGVDHIERLTLVFGFELQPCIVVAPSAWWAIVEVELWVAGGTSSGGSKPLRCDGGGVLLGWGGEDMDPVATVH